MFRNLSTTGKLSLALVIIVLSGIAVFLLSLLLAIPLYGVNLIATPDALNNPENSEVAKFFQITNSIGIFILPAILIAYLFEARAFGFLAMDKKPYWSNLLIIILSMYLLLPTIERVSVWNAGMVLPDALAGLEQWMRATEEAAAKLTTEFLRMDSLGVLGVNLLMIALIPALGEELLFRGVIQQYLVKWFRNKHVAVWVTAFFFSALHMQFFGFLPRFLLGVYLGYIFLWSQNLWYPILGHFVNNASAVVFYYFYQDQLAEKIADPEMLPQSPWLLLSSLFVLSFMTLIFVKKQWGHGEVRGQDI